MLRLFRYTQHNQHSAVRNKETWHNGCDNEKKVATFQYTVEDLETHEAFEELV